MQIWCLISIIEIIASHIIIAESPIELICFSILTSDIEIGRLYSNMIGFNVERIFSIRRRLFQLEDDLKQYSLAFEFNAN